MEPVHWCLAHRVLCETHLVWLYVAASVGFLGLLGCCTSELDDWGRRPSRKCSGHQVPCARLLERACFDGTCVCRISVGICEVEVG